MAKDNNMLFPRCCYAAPADLANYGPVFDNGAVYHSKPEYASKYSNEALSANPRARVAGQICAPMLRAIERLRLVMVNDVDAVGGIAFTDDGCVIAEFIETSKLAPLPSDCVGHETTIVKYNPVNGEIRCGTVEVPGKSSQTNPYRLWSDAQQSGKGIWSGSAIYFAVMAYAITTNDEFKVFFQNYCSEMEDVLNGTTTDTSSVVKYAATLCDNIYRRIKYAEAVSAPIELGNRVNHYIMATARRGEVVSDKSKLYGTLSIIATRDGGADPAPMKAKAVEPVSAMKGRYAFSSRVLTKEEEALVPDIADYYVMPEDVEFVARHIKESTGSKMPFRNFIFTGASGGGKTEAAKAIAFLANLPKVTLTCHPTMEAYELLVQAVPVGAESQSVVNGQLKVKMKELIPDATDMFMDSQKVYKGLTGESDDSADAVDCLFAALAKAGAELNAGSQKFKYVDSPLVQAVRNGWVVELQEPTVIMNPGVLVGLNSLFDMCQSVQLMTGEVVQRHPDCVVILTTNVDYEGCRGLNQSVISRMGMSVEFEFPSDEVIVQRVSAVTGFSDKATLVKMVTALRTMRGILYNSGATDGSLGVREMIMWAQSTLITNDPLTSAKYTVISLATNDNEVRNALITSLASVF